MTSVAMTDLGANYDRIFGPKPPSGTGRSRLCNVCGGWHSLSQPWPHNCRKEPPPRADMAAPMLAPKFTEFLAGDTENPTIINDARDKRNFMAQHDCVEYDEGVKPPPEPTEREWMDGFVSDFKRSMELDPQNRPPVEVIGQTDLAEASEIDVSEIEVAK